MKYPMKVTALAEEDGGGYQAIVPHFGRGVVGYGETAPEAVADLVAVLPTFLQVLGDTGQEIPEGEVYREVSEFSGKFNVRIPKILHAELVDLAEDNEVSLNQLVTMLLTKSAAMARSGFLFGVGTDQDREPGVSWRNQSENTIVFDATSIIRERNGDDYVLAKA